MIIYDNTSLLFTDFELKSQFPTDTFQFGGQTGNTVTQLVFMKTQSILLYVSLSK